MKPRDQVNAQLPLLDYLNRYLHMSIDERTLPKNISCPLHKDNKPSMRLYTPLDRGGYCFSCGKSYDAISIHAQLNGLSYYDSLKQLAKDLNITLEFSKETDKSTKNEITQIMKTSLAHIKTQPNLPQEFDRLVRDLYKTMRSGDITYLYGGDDEF